MSHYFQLLLRVYLKYGRDISEVIWIGNFFDLVGLWSHTRQSIIKKSQQFASLLDLLHDVADLTNFSTVACSLAFEDDP